MRTIRHGATIAATVICLAALPSAHSKPDRALHAALPAASAQSNPWPNGPMPVAIISQPSLTGEERLEQAIERAEKAASDAALVTWTKVLGSATLLLALGTIGLWWATRRLVAGAESTSEKQLRSYVFVTVHLEQAVVSTPSGNALSPIVVRFTNHGSTPAQLTKIRAMAQVLRSAPTELPEVREDEIPSGVALGPQYTESVPVQVRVSSEEWGAIERGDLTIYCFGCIEYEDVLGVRRETGFCWALGLHGRDQFFAIAPNTPLNRRT